MTQDRIVDQCHASYSCSVFVSLRNSPNFMCQFGCPLSRDPANKLAGTGGPPGHSTFKHLTLLKEVARTADGNIKDEYTSEDSNEKGTLSMANTGEPDSGGSQIFLNVADNEALDWFSEGPARHPVFGRITAGFDVVVAISTAAVVDDRIDDDADRRPLEPIRVERIEVNNLPEPKTFDPWA